MVPHPKNDLGTDLTAVGIAIPDLLG